MDAASSSPADARPPFGDPMVSSIASDLSGVAEALHAADAAPAAFGASDVPPVRGVHDVGLGEDGEALPSPSGDRQAVSTSKRCRVAAECLPRDRRKQRFA